MKCRPGFDGGLDQSFLLEVEEVPFYLFVPFYFVKDENDHDLDNNDLDHHYHHCYLGGNWFNPGHGQCVFL